MGAESRPLLGLTRFPGVVSKSSRAAIRRMRSSWGPVCPLSRHGSPQAALNEGDGVDSRRSALLLRPGGLPGRSRPG